MVGGICHIEGREVKENEQNISRMKCYHRPKRKIDFLESINQYFAEKDGIANCPTRKKHKIAH